ncbi:hypothetical protein CJP72_21505 [Citrobacter sp. NCU1]|uniref:YcbK family protein n=1 Tax=Citrobacter sp. NCU1 TaxID=2026683 RepID=UPI001390CAF4|nr:D-Ala-D-Ala carboxypeptidase family metallohydrolase [Citrobacter sp. NCU1]NDO83247.1 hypothetical protein [Citrobacter sp. NCU1]
MTSIQILKPLNVSLVSMARLNIRKGNPNTSAPIVQKIESGVLLKAIGVVSGESIYGNSDWYAGVDDTFFWSGAVKEYISTPPSNSPNSLDPINIVPIEKDLEQFIDRIGLKNFKGSEFTPYWNRVKNGIPNTVPPVALWNNIIKTVIIIDALRSELNSPIELLSTYRSPGYNSAVGGEPASYHMKFMAIDFTCSQGDPSSWASELRKFRGKFFTLPANAGSFQFHGGIGVYKNKNFVHVDTRGNDVDWNG